MKKVFILETITIVCFLTLLFYGETKLSWKHALSFVLIGASIYFSEVVFENTFFIISAVLILSTVIWYIIMQNKFFKVLITNAICLIGMAVIQVWIPLYLLISGNDYSIIQNNQYLYGLPCRIIEYIILFLIFVFKIKPKIASKGLTKLVSKAAMTSSLWWVYEPKQPKCLRR